LFLLFNVERLHEPLNVSSFVYVLAALVAVSVVGIRPFGGLRLRFVVTIPLCLYLALKLFLGYRVVGQALPITVVEICAITLTTALAYQIADRARRLEILTAGMIGNGDRQPVPMETAQSAMYREVRRARQHHRPLAVLALDASGSSNKATPEQLLQELQRDLVHKFTNCRIAELLAKEAKDHAIITQTDRHFVVLLPETDREAAEQLLRHVNQSVKSSLGLKVRVGLSTFPDEEVTLVGLLQRAESNMQDRPAHDRRGTEKVNEPAVPGARDPAAASDASRASEVKPASSRETAAEFQRFAEINGTERHKHDAFVTASSRNNRSPK
jgi:hypothetical protein